MSVIWSGLTEMATSSLSVMIVLSVTDCTVYGSVARDKSLRISSVEVSSKSSLYFLSGLVVTLSGRCTLPGRWLMCTWSLGCTSIRIWTFPSKSSLYLLCTAGCLRLALSIGEGSSWIAAHLSCMGVKRYSDARVPGLSDVPGRVMMEG